jgi:Tol biopolymer transport system component
MDELDLFRGFRSGVAAPSVEAKRRAHIRLTESIETHHGRGVRLLRPRSSISRARRKFLIVMAVVVVLAALLTSPGLGLGGRLLDLIEGTEPPQPEVQTPVWSPGGRKLLLSSRLPGNWDIYVANADGSGQRNLTHNPAFDGRPAWSPDGRRIAFVRHREGGDAVYVMNADGSGQRIVARRGNSPAWSPDGRRIAFSYPPAIWVTNPDGSEHRRLWRGPVGRVASIVWSPDGQKLAFLFAPPDNCDFCFDLHVMNADGSGLRDVAVGWAAVSDPAWSRDGRKIAMVNGRDRYSEIYVFSPDGNGLRRLTRNQATDSAPAWSPDGRKIAFVSNRDGAYQIYVMNADGSGQHALGASTVGGRGKFVGEVAAPDDAPSWSPDGRRIAFVSDRDGTYQVYVMNADGSGQHRLTQLGK